MWDSVCLCDVYQTYTRVNKYVNYKAPTKMYKTFQCAPDNKKTDG